MKIKITADSTCDLSPALLEAYDITLAPLTVLLGEDARHDGVDITAADIFRTVESGGTVTSAAVNAFEYEELFREALKGADAVIHLSLGSSFSACYTNACAAAKKVGPVYPVDTKNLSAGSGYLAIEASEMARAGMEPDAILQELERQIPLIDCSFVLDTVDYLRRGGRCSAVEAVGAKLLHIRPTIQVRDGVMSVGKKYRGSFEHCVKHYVQDKLENTEDIDGKRLFVNRSACDRNLFQTMQDTATKAFDFREVFRVHAGCTICTHCGPNTLSIVFRRKTPLK